jgi:PBSX family phage terminase large subunit
LDLTRATALLSPKQIRSIADSRARINVWSGAIRSGKTVASLLRWLIYVAAAPPGELVVVAKTSQTAARNVFAPLQDFNLFGELAAQTNYTPGAPSGKILGRRVWVIGAHDISAEGRLRGLTCAGAYVDEATLVPQAFWTQLLGRMSVPGAQMFATTNPDNPAHWLRTDFLARAGQLNLRHWHFVLADNPSLSAEYIADISAEFTGLWYRRFVLGEWVAAEGAVYDMWDPDLHVIDVLPPIVSWTGVGIDYGTTNPFAALVLGTGADSRLYLVDEWRYDSRQNHRQLTDGEYSERVRSWLNQVPVPASRRHDGTWLRGVTPRHVCVDPSAASFRTQLHRDGLPSLLAENSVLDGIRLVSTLLGKDLLKVHRSCEGWIKEVGGYSWDDRAAAAGEDKPVKMDDHSLDAGRYVVTTTRGEWAANIPLAA